MNIRGHIARVSLCERYNIETVLHAEILGTVKSDAGPVLDKTYWLFAIKSRDDNRIIDTVICGNDAAEDIFRMSSALRLPLTRFFTVAADDESGEPVTAVTKTERVPGACPLHLKLTGMEVEKNWDRAARQLFEASVLLVSAWNASDGVIFSLMQDVKNGYDRHPDYLIKSVNTIIRKGGKKLGQIALETRRKNPKLKYFDFSELDSYLKERGIESWFSCWK